MTVSPPRTFADRPAEVVVAWAQEDPPDRGAGSVFLAGPTPREAEVDSWRPAAVDLLTRRWLVDGQGRLVVFVPETRGGWEGTWEAQVAWEDECLTACDVIAFWVPRDMQTLPGLTTNVEWGRWESSGKVVLGTPPRAPHTRYLRHYARRLGVPTADTLDDTMAAALRLLEPAGSPTAVLPARVRPPEDGDEREVLTGLLDYLRATVVNKVCGLTDRQASSRAVPPSTLSAAALVKHLTGVERFWFSIDFAGLDLPWPWTETDPHGNFRLAAAESIADLLDGYRAECDRSRASIAGIALDERARGADMAFTLRYALAHMIEETARHCGHLDLLRERIDGATGE